MMDRGAVHHGPLEQLTLKQITAERKVLETLSC